MSRTKVESQILRARTQLLLQKPFFGQLAMRLKVVNASKWCPTAATDGRHFYYNEEFLKTLSEEELQFVFAHEVMHCVYQHVGPMARAGSRDKKLWNFAGDFVINLELKDQGIGKVPDIPLLMDEQFRGWFTEKVYDYLYEQNQKNKEKLKQMIGDGNFDMHIDENGDAKNGDGSQAEGQDGKKKKGPAGAGDLPTILDEEDLKEMAGKLGEDETGENGPIPLSEDDKDSLGDEWKNATQHAARGSDAGDVPAGVRRLIEDLTKPRMDWRELLNAQLKSLIKSDYTFMNPSRKTWGSDIMLPGMQTDETVDIAICIDTSGSISSDMLKDFLGEVKGIIEEFETFILRLWFFDTQTYTIHEITSDNVSDMSDIDLKIEGGGGTDFICNWEYLKKHDIMPNQLVMFTDGYPCGEWGDPDYCDTLFVIHGSEDIESPFGLSVYYEHYHDE